jgi:hypothetical protein
MSRRPARFTEADLKRAWSVAQKYGPDVVVDILPDGTISLRKKASGEPIPLPVADDDAPRVMF